MNNIELTEDLVRDGKLYPKGTKGELLGAISQDEHDWTNWLCLKIGEEVVKVTNNIKNCTDFKYKKITE